MKLAKNLLVLLAAGAFLVAAPAFGNSLDVNPSAALDGTNFGLEVATNGTSTSAFVQDDSPEGETVYRFSFWLKVDSIDFGAAPGHVILQGRGNLGNSISMFLTPHPTTAGLFQVNVKLKVDSGPGGPRTGKFNTTASQLNFIEFEWTAGDGSNNGTARLWRNGLLKGDKTGIDNDTQVIDSLRLGAPQGTATGTTGSYFVDEFSSFRTLAP